MLNISQKKKKNEIKTTLAAATSISIVAANRKRSPASLEISHLMIFNSVAASCAAVLVIKLQSEAGQPAKCTMALIPLLRFHPFPVEVLFLAWGVRLCIMVRKAPSEFNESRFISMAIYNEFLLTCFLNVSM